MAKLDPFLMEPSKDFVGIVMGDTLETPVLVASDDFLEFLAEDGYEDTMELNELIFAIQDYLRTECEKI